MKALEQQRRLVVAERLAPPTDLMARVVRHSRERDERVGALHDQLCRAAGAIRKRDNTAMRVLASQRLQRGQLKQPAAQAIIHQD
jgi:hypothetical protein